jgi:hypothetical protein
MENIFSEYKHQQQIVHLLNKGRCVNYYPAILATIPYASYVKKIIIFRFLNFEKVDMFVDYFSSLFYVFLKL